MFIILSFSENFTSYFGLCCFYFKINIYPRANDPVKGLGKVLILGLVTDYRIWEPYAHGFLAAKKFRRKALEKR